jgi:TonB family protein
MRKRFGFYSYVATSILVHAIFVISLLLIDIFHKKTQPIDSISKLVEIEFVNVDNSIEAQYVVETDSENSNNQINKSARFLSEKNNHVQKETKAKTGNKFANAPQIKKTNNSQLFEKKFDAYKALQGEDSSLLQASQAHALKQNSTLNEISTNNSNLSEVAEGFETKLNSREYKYFGYYNRIKQQLNQWWVPKVQQKFNKMLSQGRMIASTENKITRLIITLNDVGNLVNVQVLAESGVKDLDDAAIEAFRSAAPFPNPPRGIIENDGTVKIRWDCVIET